MEYYELKINNKNVFDFYKKHNLDFEKMNLIFINILENIMVELDPSFNSNFAQKLIDKFNFLDNKIDNIEKSVNDCKKELTNTFSFKLSEFRKEYMDDVKMILTNNNLEFITPLLDKTNETLLLKTSTLLKETNKDFLSTDMNSHFEKFNKSIIEETNNLLKSSLDKNTIDNFLSNVNQSLNQTQNVLSNIVMSSETRIDNRLNETDKKIIEMKDISSSNISNQQQLQTSIMEILKKFGKGSGKGNISEHIIYNILLSQYGVGSQIDLVGSEIDGTCDIIFQRKNKPKILIENKSHDTRNVPKTDIDKFIRDCETNGCSGIMLSQHRGIVNKENFEINVNGSNVLLYVQEVNYDLNTINLAIEITEQFKEKLDEIYKDTSDYTIERNVLDLIKKEYTNFITQKTSIIKIIKEFSEKLNNSVNEMKFTELEKYLIPKSAFSSIQNNSDNICKYCNTLVKKSMKQHYRYCSSYINNKNNNITSNNNNPTIMIS